MTYSNLITAYAPLPISFVRGEGIWLWDKDENTYLDSLGGIAVCNVGHCHPKVVAAISDQANTLIHTSNVFEIELQYLLAEKLTRMAGMQQIFFANSGAEANEAAIKVARLYAQHREVKQPTIAVMQGAFHGRTIATLTASSSRKVQAGFEPLLPGFVRVPYNDIASLTDILKQDNNIIAVMLEPIQGEGGINIPDDNYLNDVRKLCDQYHCLMILDEVQTGIGRTGELFAYQHSNIKPDIVTSAKALGNGIPIGACMLQGFACNLLRPGNHGSTFGGNLLACRTALTVLTLIEKENLSQHAKTIGDYLLKQLREQLAEHPLVIDIRGRGLMLGVELNQPCREMMKLGLKHRLLFNVVAEKVVRLLPPLILTEQDADQIVERLGKCLDDFM